MVLKMSQFFNETAPTYKEKKLNLDLTTTFAGRLDRTEDAVMLVAQSVDQLKSEINQIIVIQKKTQRNSIIAFITATAGFLYASISVFLQ